VRAVLTEKRDGSSGRSRHDLSLSHDYPGNRLQRDGFGESGAQGVETIRARGQRTVARLAQAQRFLCFLQFLQRAVGMDTQSFRFRTTALRRLVQLRAREGLRGMTTRRQQELPRLAVAKVGLRLSENDGPDSPAAADERQHDVPFVQCRNGVGATGVVALRAGAGRDNHQLAPANGLVHR
jgi:hypothetical protein